MTHRRILVVLVVLLALFVLTCGCVVNFGSGGGWPTASYGGGSGYSLPENYTPATCIPGEPCIMLRLALPVLGLVFRHQRNARRAGYQHDRPDPPSMIDIAVDDGFGSCGPDTPRHNPTRTPRQQLRW